MAGALPRLQDRLQARWQGAAGLLLRVWRWIDVIWMPCDLVAVVPFSAWCDLDGIWIGD
jgi:hypothetical protein